MTSILFLIGRTSGNQFNYNYVKKIKPFLNFLLNILNLHENLNILKIKMTVIRYVICKPIQLQLSKKIIFSQFSAAYLKSKSYAEHFEKKMTLIQYVFSKLETCEDVVS